VEDRKHGLTDETCSGPVEGGLPGVDVPVADGAAAQGIRTVSAQGMGGQMIDEGSASHITIVLVRDAESATREGA
jgi:hypothetical protein